MVSTYTLVALLTLLATSPFSQATPAYAPRLNPRGPSGARPVIIQMFGWSWDSIASECTDFIGPAGYGFVQTNPPQEHIQGSEWWTVYQAVSYKLDSRQGSRQQFTNMVKACHTAGVKVIADTIFNHMTGKDEGTGVAGSHFEHYDYPGIYNTENFHHCHLTSNDDIKNFRNREQVQTCELVNLADLKTESEYVRARLAEYGNDLLSLGVDGFRLDAAKHMATEDIANILSRLSAKPYITQEVVFGAGQEVQPPEYLQNGDVQEFRYAKALKESFLDGSISHLKDLDSMGWIPSDHSNVFVTNHDSERNGASLNHDSPSNTYVLATIFSLAHPYGAPTVLSSFRFTHSDAGPPNGGAGTCSGSSGTNGWLCQHRWVATAGMVGFRNAVGSAGMTHWVSPQGDRIAFGRGSAGFVAINNNDSSWHTTFTTSLPDGVYCDVITGKLSSGECTGASVHVSGGEFKATVRPRDSIAIHKEAKRA